MKRDKWYSAAITVSLIMLIITAGGCMSTTSPQGTSYPSASGTNNGDTFSNSTEAVENSPIADTTTPSDETQVGSDLVSGQSQDIDLNWEQLCLSSEYQVQIAKDPEFTIIVVDTGAFAPADSTSPAAYYPSGGLTRSPSALTPWASLESGKTYYLRVRVRQAATGQRMLSPWSEVKAITIKPGVPANNPSYGLQPLYPQNGGNNVPVKSAAFTWSPLNDTTKYRFVLAKDAAMTQVVKEAEVTTAAYEYEGQLEYSQSYFWRVMALEPVPSDWSAILNFKTEAAPLPPAEPASQLETPLWAWVVIAIGLALLIAIIVLVFRARRR
jgi:hypothetical protein